MTTTARPSYNCTRNYPYVLKATPSNPCVWMIQGCRQYFSALLGLARWMLVLETRDDPRHLNLACSAQRPPPTAAQAEASYSSIYFMQPTYTRWRQRHQATVCRGIFLCALVYAFAFIALCAMPPRVAVVFCVCGGERETDAEALVGRYCCCS